MAKIIVEVMPKAELLDPQGKAIAAALARNAANPFTAVRVGKRFELAVAGEVTAETLAQAQQIATEVLSNSVIENVVAVFEAGA
ncbi:phosphoribosylformylglycinamidine synthase subunit PurS [Canibacter sp. lx-45]|uniref:phosphoribosylformylglycinamidine synthase subunit PurS n=1 Tax=Canibacter zhuwentaonis TaxID=2837491 RepID=UPI001BDC2BBB|nr:phosphoribosylformylglycinamidine synthase subunit PurS [Canibacter zhuwentaonis]